MVGADHAAALSQVVTLLDSFAPDVRTWVVHQLRDVDPPPAVPHATQELLGFRLDAIYFKTLDQLPRFKDDKKLRDPGWWQSMILAYPNVDHLTEMTRAHGWLVTKAKGKHRRDLPSFLRNWFEKAQSYGEEL